MKLCTSCNIFKEKTLFHKDKQKKDGLRSSCKECKSKQDKKWRENNKDHKKILTEKIKERSKTWYEANKEKIAKVNQIWYKENQDKVLKYKEKQKDYMKQYFKMKYASDIRYKLRNSLNKRIRDCIRKNKNTTSYVGCDIDFLIMWFEYQFENNMTWDNYGSYWSIDHVKPCASFDFSSEEDIKLCYSQENLRPCTISENSTKRNIIYIDLINKQKEKVILFKKQFIDVPKIYGNVNSAKNNKLGYGKNRPDITMDNPQPSPKDL